MDGVRIESHGSGRTHSFWWTLTTYVFIFVAALLPRAIELGRFVTFDEASFWIQRSQTFLQAIQQGNYAATAISPHPGVTTMWLGSAGILLHDFLSGSAILSTDTFAARLGMMQLAVACAHTIGVVVGYGFLRRIADAPIALLAAMFWAFDPFVIGYSRVLHVDGLVGTFATLSLLAACSYWFHRQQWHALIISGIAGGLAFLTKSPALILVAMLALIALLSRQPIRQNWRPLVIWGAIALTTVFLLWPALWAAPQQVVALLRVGVEVQGMSPHERGNFFLGQRDEAPGVLFYPVTLALRTTPLTLIGLFLLPMALRGADTPAHTSRRRDLLVLVLFVLMFTVAMSLFQKKFNRYLVPAFPAIDILAAYGWMACLRGVWSWFTTDLRRWSMATAVLLASIAAINGIGWHPYSIAAYNQLLGGAPAGARAFMTGWGEGGEQVAAWLNEQEDITGVLVATSRTEPIQSYLRKGAQTVSPDAGQFPEKTGYVVVYIRDVQNGFAWPPFDQYYPNAVPIHQITIHEVPYAWIYRVPPPVPIAQQVLFGNGLELRGYGIETGADSTSTLNLYWQSNDNVATECMLFVHVLDDQGQRVAQVDLPLPLQTWRSGTFPKTAIPLSAFHGIDLTNKRVLIGLFEPVNAQRMPIVASNPPGLILDQDTVQLILR
jgi:hypothetical protein